MALRRGYDVAKLRVVVTILMDGDRLPREYLDHPLKGRDYKEYRGCHIEPDWSQQDAYKLCCLSLRLR